MGIPGGISCQICGFPIRFHRLTVVYLEDLFGCRSYEFKSSCCGSKTIYLWCFVDYWSVSLCNLSKSSNRPSTVLMSSWNFLRNPCVLYANVFQYSWSHIIRFSPPFSCALLDEKKCFTLKKGPGTIPLDRGHRRCRDLDPSHLSGLCLCSYVLVPARCLFTQMVHRQNDYKICNKYYEILHLVGSWWSSDNC